MTRVYTPDATGRCTGCARPEVEHSRSGGWEGDEARCMPSTETQCEQCERPVVDHVGGGQCGRVAVLAALAVETVIAPVEVTADTVTDQQIGKLRRDLSGEITNNQIKLGSSAEVINRPLHEIRHDCLIAWGHRRSPAPGGKQAAKARVASAINTRAKSVQPVKVTAESLGDIDFMDFSSRLRTGMDTLDGAEWQAAEDLRQDCRIARVYNNADARARVAAAMTDEKTALYFADGRAFGAAHAPPALTDAPEVGRMSASIAAIERAETLASDLANERAAHQLTVLELTAAREAGEKLYASLADRELDRIEGVTACDALHAEIADLKTRLLGMTACAADAARDTQAALAREGVALARVRAAGEHPALGLLVAWRKADRRDASEASMASRDALEHATSNLRGAAGSLLAASEAGAALEQFTETVTGRPYPEVSADLDAQVAAYPGAEPEGDETLVIDDPDAVERVTPEGIAEILRIGDGGTDMAHLALFGLRDLVVDWIAAVKAVDAAKCAYERATEFDLAGYRALVRRHQAALKRQDTIERALVRAVKP